MRLIRGGNPGLGDGALRGSASARIDRRVMPARRDESGNGDEPHRCFTRLAAGYASNYEAKSYHPGFCVSLALLLICPTGIGKRLLGTP